jgi:phosphoribosylformylglycinamidine synthase
MSPRVLFLRAPGTNCDEESAHAFALAGGTPERLHVNRILESPQKLAEFQILCIPGGFSYGDDLAAGRILGNQMRHHLSDALQSFRDAGKLIVGICNGFQILLKTDLLLLSDSAGPTATLAANESRRFEDRWVRLAVDGNRCVFLSGIAEMELPVAHGEGRFVPRDEQTLAALRENGQLVLRYVSRDAAKPQAVGYPDNPNGAIDNIAGICDATGRVFGLMPHPERFVDPTQHPTWTRGPHRDVGDGLRVFQNAVRYFR